MKLNFDDAAAEVPSEEDLRKRLAKLAKRDDGRVRSHIGVKNTAGQVRLEIETHTPSEDDGVQSLLERLGYTDQLAADTETTDEDGETGFTFDQLPDDRYTCVFAPAGNKLK